MRTVTISVVIPTLNAAKTLASTLSALQNNTVRPEEVLVVDGLSQDGTSRIAGQFGCPVVPNPALHTAAARQLGLASARSAVVAMTDADCVPCQDWLERIRDHFVRDPALDGVSGPIRLDHPGNRVQAYCARKATFGIPKQVEIITRKGMRGRFSGANCAYQRQVVLDAGGFDCTFEAHGEDIDLFWRLVDLRARLLFDPALNVEHLGFAQDHVTLARKSFRYGMASARLDRSHSRGRGPGLSPLWKPWSATVREFLRRDGERYERCVFVDNMMFGMGRIWGCFRE